MFESLSSKIHFVVSWCRGSAEDGRCRREKSGGRVHKLWSGE